MAQCATLHPGQVLVWRIHLDVPETYLNLLTGILSPDELARADRFLSASHRHHYITGRGALRCILGRCLNIAPHRVQFDYQEHGKPVLAQPRTTNGNLSFNFSHSLELALCAVTLNSPIGVDVEYHRQTIDLDSIAQRYFCPHEYAVIRSAPADESRKLFLRYWTCKEAYIKAIGKGLSQLESAHIDLRPKEPAQLRVPGNWRVYELNPADGYSAAVVVAGTRHQVQCGQYESGPRPSCQPEKAGSRDCGLLIGVGGLV